MEVMDVVEFTLEITLPHGQQLPDYLQGLVESSPGFVLIDAHASVFTASEPAANAADDLAAGSQKRVQHVDVFGDPYRIVPGQYHNHRAEIHAFGDTGDIREILQRIGD